MDFGENLKRAREEKGLTQQHLADELFVTRQAVSKWECGTRYPDLLTTKCIAKTLGVSIDSLVSDEEVKQISEKQSIVQNTRSDKLISSFYAVMALLSVVIFVPHIANIIGYFMSGEKISNVFSLFMITAPLILYIASAAISGVAFIKSMKDEITPKTAGVLGVVFYGFFAAKTVIVAAFNKPLWQQVTEIAMTLIFIIAICEYFFSGRSVFSKVIYLGCIVTAIFSVISPLLMVESQISNGLMTISDLANVSFILDILIGVSFAGILFFQTLTLEKKRKLCKKIDK